MGQLARQRIWESRGTTGNERLILLALADATPDGKYTCYPSVQTLADMAGVSARQGQRIIQALTESNKIAVVPGRGRNHTTRYAVLVELSDEEVAAAMIELKGDTAMSPIPTDKGDRKGDIKHDTALSPFETEKVTDFAEKVTDRAIKGDTAMSPEQKEQSHEQSLLEGTPSPAPTAKPKKIKLPDPNQAHPAVIAFYEKTARRPNRAQAHLIAERVDDIERWQGTMAHWLLNGWRSANVDGMVQRYERIDDRQELPNERQQLETNRQDSTGVVHANGTANGHASGDDANARALAASGHGPNRAPLRRAVIDW